MRMEVEISDDLIQLMEHLFPERHAEELKLCASVYHLLMEDMESEFASLVAGAALCSLFKTNPDVLQQRRVQTMMLLLKHTITASSNPFNLEVHE